MYNGEFAKGFVHVLIFATLIWMTDHVSGIFGLGIAAFVIYMPIEAYQTARAREMGLPAPDPLGLNQSVLVGIRRLPGRLLARFANAGAAAADPAGRCPTRRRRSRSRRDPAFPIGAFILIGLGVLFLLDELGALHFDWIWRFWPLILIAIGVRVLMQRQRRGW